MTLSHEYTVSLQIAAPRTIAAVHARLSIGEVPITFRRYLDQVYAAARAGAVQLDARRFGIAVGASLLTLCSRRS